MPNAEYRDRKCRVRARFAHRCCALLTTIGAAPLAVAQQPARTAPTAADWAGLANCRLHRSGIGFGGPAGRGGVVDGALGRWTASRSQLTPAYGRERRARLGITPKTVRSELSPSGMPGHHGQRTVEFCDSRSGDDCDRAYSQVRHIYTDGRPLPRIPIRSFTARRSDAGTRTRSWRKPSASRRKRIRPGDAAQRQDEDPRALQAADPDTMTIETTTRIRSVDGALTSRARSAASHLDDRRVHLRGEQSEFRRRTQRPASTQEGLVMRFRLSD